MMGPVPVAAVAVHILVDFLVGGRFFQRLLMAAERLLSRADLVRVAMAQVCERTEAFTIVPQKAVATLAMARASI